MNHISDQLKHWFDAISITAILGTFIDALPHIASLLSVIWFGLRIYETKTVQGVLNKAKEAAKIANE